MSKPILLAEDCEDDELFFKLVMKENGVKNPITVVRDGLEVIAYMEGTGVFSDRHKHPMPNVLFLDLKMPRADGFEVLEWLQSRPKLKKELLVIVLTQFGDASQIQCAYDLGAASFLAKPFSSADAENLIRHFDGYWTLAPQLGGGALNP